MDILNYIKTSTPTQGHVKNPSAFKRFLIRITYDNGAVFHGEILVDQKLDQIRERAKVIN